LSVFGDTDDVIHPFEPYQFFDEVAKHKNAGNARKIAGK